MKDYKPPPTFDSLIPVLEMDKGVVLDLLDPLDLAVRLEDLPELVLGGGDGEVPAVEDLHLGHGLLVGLLLEGEEGRDTFNSFSAEFTLGSNFPFGEQLM